jgi:hypothetical protein
MRRLKFEERKEHDAAEALIGRLNQEQGGVEVG